MSSQHQQNGDSSNTDHQDADFARAFQELAQGERTATQLENHLTQLEAKIEELLAQANTPPSSTSTTNNTSTNHSNQ